MERSFRHNFGQVRIHRDELAARSLGARAFTVGSNIVVGGGYVPGQQSSTSMLAHELTHVVQQRNQQGPSIAPRASQLAEAEARTASVAASRGRPVGAISSQPLSVARQDLDAGVQPDAGTPSDAGTAESPEAAAQTSCVIRLGGCPNSRPGGIPTPEEIANYNTECRRETAYTGPDITPSDEQCTGGGSGGGGGSAYGASPGSAMICSKRLEAPVAGWVANHSYIDDTGRGDCRGASMLNNYAIQTLVSGNFFAGCATKTDTSTDPQSFTPNIKRCDPAPGVSDVHACLRNAFNAYSEPSEYNNNPLRSPWGPNSNTFAATLARTCCLDSSSSGLGNVPGWDHAPAGPCPGSTTTASTDAGDTGQESTG
jgi:hypothetical protein